MREAQHILHRSFGYIISKTIYLPENAAVNRKCNFFNDDTYVISGPYINNKLYYTPEDNCIPWLMVSGKMEITNIDTGEIEIRTGGESNLKTPEKNGTYKGKCLERSIVFSIWPENNLNCSPVVPLIDYFQLKKDEIYDAPIGTKLFLALGSVKIEENIFSAERSINVKSGNKKIIALEDCYGFLFK